MTAERRRRLPVAAVVGLVAAVAYVLLGNAVAHVPPSGIDRIGRELAGEWPALALVFTESCWWPALTVYGVAGIAVAVASPAWRGRIIFSIVTTLVTWQASDALKNVFARPRPSYWLVIHEPSYAYSSGHAMFAVLVYWVWAYFFVRSTLPIALRIALGLLLGGWGAGVIWSRLALGAHYPTDLIGGVLLAVTALSIATLVATLASGAARRGSLATSR